jgi:hypothetical protein
MIKFSLTEPEAHNEEGRPWYDTRGGIERSIQSLEGFVDLLYARHVAGYQREEGMNEFWILGRYNLDTVGNCGKVSGQFIPKEEHPDIPDVMTRDEFWQYLKERSDTENGPSVSWSMESDLPLPGVTCPHCGRSWGITNCHDTVVRHLREDYSLQEFVGQTLGDVKAAYAARTDAVYRMQPDILIRNDRFVDLSPEYPETDDEWKKGLVINEGGWVSESDGITDDYVIQDGDEGFFNVWQYFHSTCNRENLKTSEEQRFREVFTKAGFDVQGMEAIPNQYCGCDSCAPWFVVCTEYGPVTIGWRKRVINIDWNELNIPDTHPPGFSYLFEDEDVTKGAGGIHAWGWDKATEYLSRIHRSLAA